MGAHGFSLYVNLAIKGRASYEKIASFSFPTGTRPVNPQPIDLKRTGWT
jgi:hypothetical protein